MFVFTKKFLFCAKGQLFADNSSKFKKNYRRNNSWTACYEISFFAYKMRNCFLKSWFIISLLCLTPLQAQVFFWFQQKSLNFIIFRTFSTKIFIKSEKIMMKIKNSHKQDDIQKFISCESMRKPPLLVGWESPVKKTKLLYKWQWVKSVSPISCMLIMPLQVISGRHLVFSRMMNP